MYEVAVEDCIHPQEFVEHTTNETAVPRSHPGYAGERIDHCTVCGYTTTVILFPLIVQPRRNL